MDWISGGSRRAFHLALNAIAKSFVPNIDKTLGVLAVLPDELISQVKDIHLFGLIVEQCIRNPQLERPKSASTIVQYYRRSR